LKVGKELVRGWDRGGGGHAGDKIAAESSGSQALRWGLVVGGEGLDEQFEMITNNPDVYVVISCQSTPWAESRSVSSQHLVVFSTWLLK